MNDTLSTIAQMKADGASWAEIAHAVGMTKEAARHLWRRNGKPVGEIEHDNTKDEFVKIVHDGSRGKGSAAWREIVDEAKRRGAFRSNTFGDFPQEASVELNCEYPPVIVFSGDWHLGAGRTDYTQWLDDIEFVMQTQCVFLVDVGDDRENIRRFKTLSAVFAQTLSPTEQATLVKGIVDELTDKNKLLAKVGGNHDIEFDERAGFAELVQAYVYRNMNAPLFANRGIVHLSVGDVTYDMLLFHKSRFRSFLTPTHGARRELMLAYPQADIVAGGHDHQPGIEVFWYNMLADSQPSVLIKVGTYSDSVYGWRYFHNGGFPINPAVVLLTKERKVIPFADPRDAVTFARALGGSK